MVRYKFSLIVLSGLLLSGCLTPAGQPLSPDDNKVSPEIQELGTVEAGQYETEGLVVSDDKVANKPGVKPAIVRETLTQLADLSPEKRAEILIPNSGLIPFDQEKYEKMKGNKEMALFFYADWCDTCRQMEGELEKGKGLLPGGLVLYKVDFQGRPDLVENYEAKVGQVVVLDEQGQIFSRFAGIDFNGLIFDLRKVME